MVKNESNENKSIRLEWFPLKRFNDNAGEILAYFELFSYTDETRNLLPPLPPKKPLSTKKPIQTLSNLYGIPPQIRPELQRTIIEVSIFN